jgi:hypothetical protein
MSGGATAFKVFQQAENLLAFGKVGLYGAQGSGKTTTAMKVAVGLARLTTPAAPIAFMDTETGSDFFVERMKAEGIPFYQLKTRAFRQLQPAIEEAEAQGAVLVIDSVSHFWDEIRTAYAEKLHRTRLQFEDWAVIKDEWRKGYATPFINAKCHIIVCGRSQDTYEDFFDDQGRREIAKTGTRMRAEREFGYEPSLVLEMEGLSVTQDALRAAKDKRERQGAKISSERIIRATVLKDRADVLNGQVFDFPDFETFQPHFSALNLKGKHLGVDTKTSVALFGSESEAAQRINKQRTIALEEIQGELAAAFPGQDKEAKTIKTDLVHAVFGTRSWTSVEGRKLDELERGLAVIRSVLPGLKDDANDVYAKVEAAKAAIPVASDEDPFLPATEPTLTPET